MRVGPVHQLACSVELLVLNDERKVGHTQLQVERFGQFALVIVIDQEKTCQAVVGLLGGQLMRMGVVPIGATAVVHGEVVVVARARRDRVARMPVHLGRRVQAVPVNDGRLGQ